MIKLNEGKARASIKVTQIKHSNTSTRILRTSYIYIFFVGGGGWWVFYLLRPQVEVTNPMSCFKCFLIVQVKKKQRLS